MKPGTPHFVFTPEHSICYGGHFFMTRTMRQTLQGLIHTFVLHQFLTNISHPPTRLLFRRMVLFYHHGLIDSGVPHDGR